MFVNEKILRLIHNEEKLIADVGFHMPISLVSDAYLKISSY